MKIIAISYPEEYKEEHNIINELFNNGLEIFHLRKPLWTFDKIVSLLDMIDASFHNRIVLHSHYELSEGLKGIHFTGKNKHLIKEYKNVNIHKSISCHSFEETQQYAEIMDYSFISPVFDSISKKGYKANIDFACLKENAKKQNLVLLGGINNINLNELKEIRPYGIAILGHLWDSNNVIKAFKDIQECI
jgi:thiamine-phosphate pyrophosphorylase